MKRSTLTTSRRLVFSVGMVVVGAGLSTGCDPIEETRTPTIMVEPTAPSVASPPLRRRQSLSVSTRGRVRLVGSNAMELVELPRRGDAVIGSDGVAYRHHGGSTADSFVARVDGVHTTVSIEVEQTPEVAAEALLWFDAAEHGEVAGTPVSSWPSRGELTAWSSDPQTMPRWARDGHPELGAVHFTENDSLRTGATLPDGPYTWVAALRLDPGFIAERPGAVISGHGGRAGLYMLGEFPASRGYRPGKPTDFVLGPDALAGWSVVVGRWNGQWHEVWVDGRLVAALPWSAAPLGTPIFLGKGESAVSRSFQGWLGEAFTFDRALDERERRELERYLMGKWGTGCTVFGIEDADGAGLVVGTDDPEWLVGSGGGRLVGNGGDDELQGQDGDVLVGGPGKDRFMMPESGTIIIEDFEAGRDRIIIEQTCGELGTIEDYVSVRIDADSVLVQVEGASARLLGVTELTFADVETGIVTPVEGLKALEVVIAGASEQPHVGEPTRWTVTAEVGGVRQHVSRADMAIQGGLTVLARSDGHAWFLAPGERELTVTIGDEEPAELEATVVVTVTPPPALPFEEEESPKPPLAVGAYQGGAWLDGQLYLTANLQEHGAWLYRLDSNWSLIEQTAMPTVKGVHMHVGAVAIHGRRLYAPMLDPVSQGAAEPITGIAILDADTLEVIEVVDTTGIFRYIDAITIETTADGATMWLPTVTDIARVPLDDLGPDLTAIERWAFRGDIGAQQGIAIAGDHVFVVPENGTANPEMIGIVVFRRSTLRGFPRLPEYSGVAAWFVPEWANLPEAIYPVAFPAHHPDHESLFFDPMDPEIAYLPWIPGSYHLARLRLTLPQ